MNGTDLVASTTDPAFTTDEEGIIRAWNAAAEEAFGLTAAEACGTPCSKTLAGNDPYGNDYCCESCPLRRMALAATSSVGRTVGPSFSTNTYGGMSSDALIPKNESKPKSQGPF